MNSSNVIKNNTTKFSALPGLESVIDICVYVTLICNFLILLGNPLQNDFIVSLGTRVMIIFILLLAILAFVNNIKRTRVDKFNTWFVLLAVSTAFAVLLTCTTSAYAYIIQYMCFIMLPAYAVLYRNVFNIKKLKNAIYIANIFYTLIYIWLYFSDISHIFHGEYGDKIIEDLTLGYNNQNEAAIYLFLSFVIMLSACKKFSNVILRSLTIILSVFLLIMIGQTNSRTALILSLVLVLFFLTKWIYKIGNNFFIIVLLLPALFAILTLLFPEFFEELMIWGQSSATGRTIIYKRIISELNVFSFLFGSFNKYPGSNLHNSYISIFAMFGLPITFLYIKFLKTTLNNYFSNLIDTQNYIAFFGFLMVIVHGVAEGTLLISGSVYAGLTGLLFILMLPDKEEKKV